MKRITYLGSLLAVGLALTSCNTTKRLAKNITGEWTSNPETLLDTGATQASVTRVMEFNYTGNNQGSVTFTAMVTVDNTMPYDNQMTTPLSVTASGVATINGTYQAEDDDELIIHLDPTSMNVTIDPDAVTLNYNVLTTESSPAVDALKPAAMMLAKQQITRAAQKVIANITEVDDIRINGNLMTCEISHKDLNFARSSAAK